MQRSLFFPLVAAILASGSSLAPVPLLVNDPPLIEHQPAQCSLESKPIELCAAVFDDGDIAKVRAYFKKPGEKFPLIAEMAFEGARFCTTIPGVKPGKLRSLEYYIQAFDTEYASKRTSTYQLLIQSELDCPFPAVQNDAKKAESIAVFATSAKQGSKLPDYLEPAGVTFTSMAK